MHGKKKHGPDPDSISDWPSETDKIWLIPPFCNFFLSGSTSIVDRHREKTGAWNAVVDIAMHLFGKQWDDICFYVRARLPARLRQWLLTFA